MATYDSNDGDIRYRLSIRHGSRCEYSDSENMSSAENNKLTFMNHTDHPLSLACPRTGRGHRRRSARLFHGPCP
jgi:hypothetical protein